MPIDGLYTYDDTLPPASVALAEALRDVEVQGLFQTFKEVLGTPIALIDLDANVLFTSVPWERICTQFHRADPESSALCVESDTAIAAHLVGGKPYVSYVCPNGLMDCAAPVLVDGVHVANMFTGQFLTSEPDEEFFRAQADHLGFDVDDYIAALHEVPVIEEWRLPGILDLLSRVAGLIGGLGLERKHAMDSEKRLSSILDTIPQAVFWKDRDGVYIGANQACADMVGLPDATAVVGMTDYDLSTSREHAEKYRDDDRSVIETERPVRHYVETFLDPGGSARWADVSKVPLVDDTGNVYGVLGVVDDITERRQAEEDVRRLNAELETRVAARTAELAAANARLEASNRELEAATQTKDQFLANMSHELRTPLNSVIGFTGILLQGLAGPLNDEQKRQLTMARESGKHLLELVDDVLDLSRLEAGRADRHPESFDVRSLVDEAVDAIAPLAADRHLELTSYVGPGVTSMNSDVRYVRQILVNLLGNAVKFTDEGRITLSASRSDGTVHFEVTDTGRGIAEADLPHIFEEFYQAESATEAKTVGTGLGLAVSKRLAETLGGSLAVRSRVGVGSVLSLTLPLDLA